MPYSEAQKNATLKYKKKKGYVKINLDVTEEIREKFKSQAAKHEMSLTAYIVSLVDNDMNNTEELRNVSK